MTGKLIKGYRMNNIKDNPYGKYNGKELDYILEVLDSENMDRKANPYVNRFEKKFGEVFQNKYAIAHNSGTSTWTTIETNTGLTTTTYQDTVSTANIDVKYRIGVINDLGVSTLSSESNTVTIPDVPLFKW